jgi:hypothetical protein
MLYFIQREWILFCLINYCQIFYYYWHLVLILFSLITLILFSFYWYSFFHLQPFSKNKDLNFSDQPLGGFGQKNRCPNFCPGYCTVFFWEKKNWFLTSDPPLKETVLGVFDLAEIVAGGSKNKQIDGFCAKFFA